MTNALVFDCLSGVSGDMVLGALIDAGADLDFIRSSLTPLGLPTHELSRTAVTRAGTRASRLEVSVEDEERFGPDQMHEMIARAGLAHQTEDRIHRCVELLEYGEAKVHEVEHPHFHEVGGVDALVDIAGSMLALESLNVESAFCPVVTVGSGSVVRTEHGVIPSSPGPAATEILIRCGFPLRFFDAAFELVTPTGAAVLGAIAVPEPQTITATAVGVGAGKHDPPGRPNILRVFVGQITGDPLGSRRATVSLLDANIDDMPAEYIAYACQQVLDEGALDAWVEPITMKKGRLGTKLSALVPVGREEHFVNLIMRETTTIGVRMTAMTRFEAERQVAEYETSLGPVRVKASRWQDQSRMKAEFDDIAHIATEQGLPAWKVRELVQGQLGFDESPR